MATTRRSGRGNGGSSETSTPATPSVPNPITPPVATASYATASFTPEHYDPAAARDAAARWHHTLAGLHAEQLQPVRVDVNAAALALLNVHGFATQVTELHARFAALATAGEFNLQNLSALRDLAFLLIDAHREAEATGAFKTDAKVPADLASAARDVEKRMQALCEYKFGTDVEIVPRLDALRPGSGPRDTALDLLGYADIYDLRPNEVVSDTTNYRATDQADARRLAGEILSCLASAMSPKARAAYVQLQRVWAATLPVYAEVQSAGLYLLRSDPSRGQRFPSLYAAGHSGRPRRKAGGASTGAEGGAAAIAASTPAAPNK
jgi:hypothetical protein